MTFEPDNRRQLVQRYLASAEERLRAAEVLLTSAQWADTISRAYYAMLDAASACLVQKDVVPKSHEGTLTLFGLHFVKTGLVDARFSEWLRKVRKARLEADYRHVHVFTEAEAREACDAARQLVSETHRVVTSAGN